LKLDVVAAAAGILRVANANMERAIRLVSLERGHDPRDFALVAFGGCGGLHACEIAAELGIRTVLVPEFAGALSALGMLLADNVRDYAIGVLNRTDFERQFARLERNARGQLSRAADIRYAGQSYELTVPWNAEDPGAPFHREHERVYGYSDPARPVEVVALRVRARIVVEKPVLKRGKRSTQAASTRRIHTAGAWHDTVVLPRGASRGTGPALIVDYGSTTLVPPGWIWTLDKSGTLVVKSNS
jgi:N-methylhydantoinase A